MVTALLGSQDSKRALRPLPAALLSVVVPTFNEVENVEPLLARTENVLHDIPYEVNLPPEA